MGISVSVIIPTFNRQETLKRAILSVLKQTYQDFDLWIIDDGSTDRTEETVKNLLGNQARFHYHKTENKGVSAARNLGITLSTGEWVAFLDSDDEWLPHRLEWQMEAVKGDPLLKIIHGEEIWIRNGVRVNPMKKHQKGGGDLFEKNLGLCLISPSAVLLRRTLLVEEVGLFREDFPVCEDYDLWLRITSLYPVGYLEKPIINKYGGHEDQLSRKFFAMDYWRVKSMDHLLEIRPLLGKRREEVLSEMERKGTILLRGYKKHHNWEHFSEIREIMERRGLAVGG